ncbi:MAG: PAS domain S-box protein [Thermodesulfobacteriota bacterium]
MEDTIQTQAELREDRQGLLKRISELETAEREQRQCCEMYQNIFELAPHSASITRTEDGCFLKVNQTFSRMTGYLTEEVLGRTSLELNLFADPEDRGKIVEALRQDGQVKGWEIKLRKKDGTFFHGIVSARLYTYNGENCILLMLEDISRIKEMEISLKESEEKYRQVVENAGEGILVAQDGKVRFTNHRTAAILGYEVDEIRDRTYLDFIHPDDGARIVENYVKRIAGEPVPEVYEFRALTKDGRVRILEIRSARVHWEGRPATLNLLADVTERKEVEEKYRVIVETMEEGYYEVDLTGTYTFVNPAVCRYHKATREELIGLNYRDYMPPETANKVFQWFNDVYRTGVPARIMRHGFEVLRQDGTIIPLDLSVSLRRDAAGKPIGFHGISFDASERLQIEAERERYRQFVEEVDDGCFENDLQGKFIFVNPSGLKRFGYSWEELKQLDNRRYTTPETARRVYKIYNEVYQTGTPATILDYEIIRKDGSRRYLDLSVSLMRDKAGKPIGFRGTSHDIMERKKMEVEREQLAERLNQARKMEAIGTLAAGVAHDFNNLLMGIQGYSSLMLLDLDPGHPHYQQLKAIESQVKAGAELTRQLLGYARGGRYEVLPTDFNELINRTVSLFSRMKQGIRIHPYLSDALWTVDMDRSQIEQVLMSLFMNAAEAMPGGGSLFLQTENILLEEPLARTYEIPPGPYVKLSITDTGVGMDETTRERIFEPFFTTKEMGRGIGLGLASVYGIIQGHQGVIEVQSEKGQGTTFFIYLPVRLKKDPSPTEEAVEKPSSKGTILLVDDETVIIDVVRAMLKGLGYEILVARDGETAVQLYRDKGEDIDLVIMDMVMPGIGGGEAIDLIKSIDPAARIVLASGYSLAGEAKEILNRGGAQLFLQKPFQLQELSTKIRQILEGEE